MTSDDEFTRRLIGFGLSEKEAMLYLHLLKYGPKTPSPLAKSLHTYREDAHRTLTSLIDKGMVRPSLDSPTVYAAVDLDTALGSALQKQQSELREMEERRRELQQLSQQQRFRPSDEISTFKIIKSIKELIAVSMPLLDSLQEEWLVAAPAYLTVVASLFGVNDAVHEFIKRGGKVRAIIDISYQVIEPVQEMIAIGEEVRHIDEHGVMFVVFDRKTSISAINAEVKRISLNEPVSGLWTDDPAYAQYLASTFEMVWRQSIPAEQRIRELLRQGPPQA
jgi:HTH-type transcriptional regulator, sugar sensing transcriptional regulator